MMKLIHFFQSKKGLTLIEILIVLFITSIIAITVISVLNTSINSNQYDVDTVEDLQQARIALRRITNEINYADRNNPITIIGNRVLNYTNSNGNACRIFLNRGSICIQQTPLAPVAITTQNIIQDIIFQFDNNTADGRNINIIISLRNGKTIRATARKLNQKD